MTMGTLADADALTSLTVNANYANAVLGNIGATGTAENLATVNVTADNGATVTLERPQLIQLTPPTWQWH